jgi:hypothetical protein
MIFMTFDIKKTSRKKEKKMLYTVLIFCLVLFVYLHIQFHMKLGNDLEMYEFETLTKNKLEEICDLRQPLLFDSNALLDKIFHMTGKSEIISKYSAYEVKLKTESTEIVVTLKAAVSILNKEAEKEKEEEPKYFSESNYAFISDSGLFKNIKYYDEFLRPYMLSNTNYDILFGKENTHTPLRYELYYRTYFLVTQESVNIKLFPPKFAKYMNIIHDHEHFDNYSQMNPWNVQDEFLDDYNKMKCIEFTMSAKKIVYIPAYWGYTIQFNKDASVTKLQYGTYMNNLAILPELILFFLQRQSFK